MLAPAGISHSSFHYAALATGTPGMVLRIQAIRHDDLGAWRNGSGVRLARRTIPFYVCGILVEHCGCC